MAETRHLFIVGVSRSGTTLMRRILNRSTQVALCDENFFLGHLLRREGMRYKFRRFAPLTEDANVGRLVNWFYSPAFQDYSHFRKPNWQWQWFLENVDRLTMECRLLACDRTDRGVFALLMDLFAEAQGAGVRGEKTPAHIRHVSTLMEWFPKCHIIHMMRDPRAIYTSEVRRRREKSLHAPYRQLRRIPGGLETALLAQVTWAWTDALRRSRRYRDAYGERYRVVRFEDLVADPVVLIGDICAWANLEFQERMLDQFVVSEGFSAGKKGFDREASRRWAAHIGPVARWWLEARFRGPLRELGYED